MLLDLKYLVAEKLQTGLLLLHCNCGWQSIFNGSCHGMYLMDEDPQITYLWEKENEENRVSPKKTFRFLSSFHHLGISYFHRSSLRVMFLTSFSF